MPVPPGDLRRGRIFYGIFPFASGFPLVLEGDGDRTVARDIETFARTRRGRPTVVVTKTRLRPVLLLHDGTRGEHENVLCLRISGVKPAHRRDPTTWSRIERREHPLLFHLPAADGRYGLGRDSVVALASIGTVHKSAILGPRHIGDLTVQEMQIVSERLARVLSLDLAPMIAARAQELLRRAGLGPNQARQ